jgi:hypothetical protein
MISRQETLRAEFTHAFVAPERREVLHSHPRMFNDDGEEVFVAGQWVPAGTYRLVDSYKTVTLEAAGLLPPSFDGRRAEYCRLERPWSASLGQ